jgi:hypothetical protein
MHVRAEERIPNRLVRVGRDKGVGSSLWCSLLKNSRSILRCERQVLAHTEDDCRRPARTVTDGHLPRRSDGDESEDDPYQ